MELGGVKPPPKPPFEPIGVVKIGIFVWNSGQRVGWSKSLHSRNTYARGLRNTLPGKTLLRVASNKYDTDGLPRIDTHPFEP